jgi:hypothetical protein
MAKINKASKGTNAEIVGLDLSGHLICQEEISSVA